MNTLRFVKILRKLFGVRADDDVFEWILYLGPSIPQNAVLAHIDGNDNLTYFANINQKRLKLVKIFQCCGDVCDKSIQMTLKEYFIVKEVFEIIKLCSDFDFKLSESGRHET